MANMRKLLLVFLLLCAEVNAWQLNSSLVLDNANTESCIASTNKVGDKIRSPIGSSSYSIVKSLSGTSSRCQAQTHPILANVETVIGVSPHFQMEIPDDYKAYPITDVDKFNGIVLNAGSGNDGNKWLYVFIRQRETSITPEAIMQATINTATPLFKEAPVIKNQEELIINGMKAWRFEMIGATKKLFAPSLTYLNTVLEGDNEYLFIEAYTKTSNYEQDKQSLSSLAYKVSGLKSGLNEKSHDSKKTSIDINEMNSEDLSEREKAVDKIIQRNEKNSKAYKKQTIETEIKKNDLEKTLNDKAVLDQEKDKADLIRNAKKKCEALGFEINTPKNGKCVLELIK
jgi:hypothetical protein